MIKWLKRIIQKLKGQKQNQQQNQSQKENKPTEVFVPKKPELVLPEPEENIWDKWCKDAMIQSGSFEGKGTDWANVVPNFDGAILTCGLLGFTWKWNNQAPMVLEFVKRHGEGYFMSLMPKSGPDYLRACTLGEEKGKYIILNFSNSKTVFQPYKQELTNLWGSEEMIKIQVETSKKMFGVFAQKQCLEGQKFFNLKEPSFHHYRYWFDQAVLNGTGKTVAFNRHDDISNKAILDWCKSASGYTINDLRRNVSLWEKALKTASGDKQALWRMAYLRAQNSRSEFKPVTMNRRGTLALGVGYVNGSKRILS